jgi:hypothetical protein
VPVWVTGTLPPLPGGALSSASPVTKMTITTAATATTNMMSRAVFAGTRMSPRSGERTQAACALCSRGARASLGAISTTSTSTTACPTRSSFTVPSTASSWRDPLEKLPDRTVASDPGVLPVVLAADDYDALDIGE